MRTPLKCGIGTNVQAYDADLSAIAGLTSAADKGIQFTGAGTAGTFDLTAAGKALLDDADAAAQRATLGLTLGVEVQAYSGMLLNIANCPQPYDQFIYYDSSGLATRTAITTAGRNLLDDADASAMRTTLGVAIGTNVQAYSSRLTDLSTILVTPLASGSQAAVSGTAGASYTSTEQQMINDLKTLVNQLRADLVTARIIKGSA